jgi:outer membrane protein TolC
MVDIIEMKQRVAATEEKIKAANAQGVQQNERLLHLLQAVETNLLRNQSEIQTLKAERAAAKDEIETLKNMLRATLSLAETNAEARPSLPRRDLDSLLARLGELVDTAHRDQNKTVKTVKKSAEKKPEAPTGEGDKPAAKPKKRTRSRVLSKLLS